MGRRRAGLVFGAWMVSTVLVAVFGAAVNVGLVGGSGTIFIRADGSVEGTDKIISSDNVTYTFTGSIYDSIVVERSDIIIDGAGYTLEGYGYGSGNGFLLSSMRNVTIRNTNIQGFRYGVYLNSTSYSVLSRNRIVNNHGGGWHFGAGVYVMSSSHNTLLENEISYNDLLGISLYGLCDNNTVSGNTITNNIHGVYLEHSSYNTILSNNITNNDYGVLLSYSSGNIVSGNNITNNEYGIWLDSFWNCIIGNSFIDNTNQVYSYGVVNTWDNGYPSGGNYWSDYTGADSNHDGIGDSWHQINENNADHYPLIGMFSSFDATTEYSVQTICNSTVSGFHFNGTAMSFSVSGENGTAGFCRICIPRALMNGTYHIYINGSETPYNSLEGISNSTHNYLYFTYEHSTKEVVIIPEFPLLIILPLFMIATLLAIVYRKRRIRRQSF